MLPARYQVVERQEETRDTVTLCLRPVDQPIPEYRPGQFTMLYAPGIGEVPISISGTGPDLGLVQTIRAVGAGTRALCACAPGRMIGVRGPYGTDWDVASAAGDDLLIVAGGIGLAPLRGALLAALGHREAYRRVVVLAGARSPEDCLEEARRLVDVEPDLLHPVAIDPDVHGAFAFDAGEPAGQKRAIAPVGHCALPG